VAQALEKVEGGQNGCSKIAICRGGREHTADLSDRSLPDWADNASKVEVETVVSVRVRDLTNGDRLAELIGTFTRSH